MRTLLALVLVTLLAGCATAPPSRDVAALFHDELFAAPTERVGEEAIFALSEPMRRYLRDEIGDRLRTLGPQASLVEALYRKGQLRLEYDASVTRNAAETFEARAGNCLSLVVMTAAFARELHLRVQFQSADLEEAWSRNGNLLVRSHHVNITLGPRLGEEHSRFNRPVTIDFLPPEDIRGLHTREIDESTIVAMYMNNRAVEAVVQRRVDDAYAWARAAIHRRPSFLAAYTTLGTVYLTRGSLAHAARAFEHVLATDARNTHALANLAETRARQGRGDEARALRERLAQLEEAAPFHHFTLGMAAMRREDYRAARDLFAKEIARAEYNPEVQYWMAMASAHLGDHAAAAKHLALAHEYSTTRSERERYGAKLARLKAHAHN